MAEEGTASAPRWSRPQRKAPQTVVNVTNQPKASEVHRSGQIEKKPEPCLGSPWGEWTRSSTEFKPEYLTIGDKVETTLLGWQEKVLA